MRVTRERRFESTSAIATREHTENVRIIPISAVMLCGPGSRKRADMNRQSSHAQRKPDPKMTRLPSGLLTYVEKAIVIPSAKSIPVDAGAFAAFGLKACVSSQSATVLDCACCAFRSRPGCLCFGVKVYGLYEGYDFLLAVDV